MFRPVVRQGHAVFADGGCPNRGGKVGIVFEAGDDVPMQMGDDVAQAGKVDFGGTEHLAHGGFDFIHHSMISARSAAERSVISAMWSFQMTRQNAGAEASLWTAITRRFGVCSKMSSLSAVQMGQVMGFSRLDMRGQVVGNEKGRLKT